MSVDAVAALAGTSAPEPPSTAAAQGGAVETPLSDAQVDAAAAQLLRDFLGAHEARARHYARLHEGFKAMLQSGQEAPYRELLAELTGSFNDVSKQVIAIERQLAQQLQRPQMAAPLRSVQEQERSKLRYTLTLQALRQAEARQGFSWQLPDQQRTEQQQAEHPSTAAKSSTAAAAPTDAEQVPDQGMGEGAPPREGHSCSHAHACCGGGPAEDAPEPTEAEFRGAVEEASQLLNGTVEAINESIEEVRYALEDLAEAAAAGTDA